MLTFFLISFPCTFLSASWYLKYLNCPCIVLAQATVRLESFEHYVESIFGPNGKLSSVGNAGISKLLSSLRRTKRAVPSKRKMRTLALGYDAMRRYYNDPIVIN